jgi:hypothetical protein
MNLGYDIRRDQVFSEPSLSVACTANHPVREVEVG